MQKDLYQHMIIVRQHCCEKPKPCLVKPLILFTLPLQYLTRIISFDQIDLEINLMSQLNQLIFSHNNTWILSSTHTHRS